MASHQRSRLGDPGLTVVVAALKTDVLGRYELREAVANRIADRAHVIDRLALRFVELPMPRRLPAPRWRRPRAQRAWRSLQPGGARASYRRVSFGLIGFQVAARVGERGLREDAAQRHPRRAYRAARWVSAARARLVLPLARSPALRRRVSVPASRPSPCVPDSHRGKPSNDGAHMGSAGLGDAATILAKQTANQDAASAASLRLLCGWRG